MLQGMLRLPAGQTLRQEAEGSTSFLLLSISLPAILRLPHTYLIYPHSYILSSPSGFLVVFDLNPNAHHTHLTYSYIYSSPQVPSLCLEVLREATVAFGARALPVKDIIAALGPGEMEEKEEEEGPKTVH